MCGVFGVYAPDRDVARLTYFGLFALQHRGQESAGIAVSENGRLTGLRDLGLVSQVFDEQKLRGLHGQVAIGHTRYSTTGSSAWANAQPLLQHGRARTVALGHNGNLSTSRLREELRAAGITLGTTSDSELIAALIANDRAPLDEAVASAMRRLEGALLDRRALRGTARRLPRPARLPAARDRASATIGSLRRRRARSTSSAPSSCARSRPASSSSRMPNGLARCRRSSRRTAGALCIWEFFYLARPDTRLEGVEVHSARVRMGERLAQEAPVDADLVLPIPDSGTPAAIGFARALGLPFSEGLIKNRYVQRTFIQPEQELRRAGNPDSSTTPLAEVAGKRVVAVDDSIVRGNTTREIVRMLFDAGATEVHVRVSSPPVIGQCFYGIDLADPSRDDRRHADGRGSPRARGRHLARVPLPRRARGGDTAAGVGSLPCLPHGRLPDGSARQKPRNSGSSPRAPEGGGAALPLPPRHESRSRGRGAVHRQARIRPRRAPRPDRRGAHLLRARVAWNELDALGFKLRLTELEKGAVNVVVQPGQWPTPRVDHLGFVLDEEEFERAIERAEEHDLRVQEHGGRRTFVSTNAGYRLELHPPREWIEELLAQGEELRLSELHLKADDPAGKAKALAQVLDAECDGSSVEVGETVVRFVRGGPQGRPELFGELFV